jgi:hypothetical protein
MNATRKAGSGTSGKSKATAAAGGGYGATLLAIEAMRSGAAYQQAEMLRRSLGENGAEQMASKGPASKEYAAVRLLIGTWEAIAAMVQADPDSQTRFFETQPVFHMWDALKDGVKRIQKDLNCPHFAKNFESLACDYDAWCDRSKKSKAYRTQACNGITARFG